MPNYEFNGCLYSCSSEMCAAIAFGWLSAGGANSAEVAREFLKENTDEVLAAEAIAGWGLNEIVNQDAVSFDDADPETWMERQEIDAADIAYAFYELRDDDKFRNAFGLPSAVDELFILKHQTTLTKEEIAALIDKYRVLTGDTDTIDPAEIEIDSDGDIWVGAWISGDERLPYMECLK